MAWQGRRREQKPLVAVTVISRLASDTQARRQLTTSTAMGSTDQNQQQQQRQDPKEYEKSRSLVARDLAEFLPDIINIVGLGSPSQSRQGATWLDFGCGDGSTLKEYFLPQAIVTGSEFWALDISEDMVRHA